MELEENSKEAASPGVAGRVCRDLPCALKDGWRSRHLTIMDEHRAPGCSVRRPPLPTTTTPEPYERWKDRLYATSYVNVIPNNPNCQHHLLGVPYGLLMWNNHINQATQNPN